MKTRYVIVEHKPANNRVDLLVHGPYESQGDASVAHYAKVTAQAEKQSPDDPGWNNSIFQIKVLREEPSNALD